MRKMDNEQRMQAIYKGFHGYEKIVDQEVHYVYLDKEAGRYKELVLKPHSKNFMHLCGVDFIGVDGRKLKAFEFYGGLRDNLLKSDGIRKKDATTDLKLDVIPYLSMLTSCRELKVIDTEAIFLKNRFTHAIRTRKKIFVLGMEKDSGTQRFFPKSLLNVRSEQRGKAGKKTGKKSPTEHQVHCIYSVDINTKKIHQVFCKDSVFEAYEQKHGYTYKTVPQGI